MGLKFYKRSFYIYFVPFGVKRPLGAKEATMEQVTVAE